MVFDADSKGPSYLEGDLLRTRKNDVVSVDTAPQTKEKTAPELKKELLAAGVQVPKGAKKDRLLELARFNEISITKSVQKMDEGWLGKPKGML